MKYYLSIDIGGTNLKYGLLDRAGHLIEHDKVPTPTSGLDDFMQVLTSIIDTQISRVRGIAISVPGKIDVSQGVVYFGGSLPFLDKVPLGKQLSEKYHVPVGLENDGKAAAMAELWLGNLQQTPNSAAVVLGTGVGGGIILNGQLLYGTHFQAGEFSFMLNDFKNSNFIDAAVGGNTSAVGMIRNIGTELSLKDPADGIAVFQQIKAGNPIAVTKFKHFCNYVAKMILNVQSVVDLQRYVIGGGISAQPLVVKTINAEYNQMLAATPIIQDSLTKPEIIAAKFGNDANLYGALYSLLQQVNGERQAVI
ncbi:ROK family protein [Lactiplantibacillus pentosus]|uniref:ROK family protein n=1 Tax=Lactiplantibacillus pentosus TaxID=1589 RepID=UPI000D01672E|nr:ROK family protein [Lactiplantibacillus pentosus]MCC3164305.1 ROK family protein [Lactiplantibacillus pentosus]MCJ8189486.1 ROK family protein [Lactiplantibacillus pentosus]PRO82301.1 ROK family protein [Lactiplantibacillus pentosus]